MATVRALRPIHLLIIDDDPSMVRLLAHTVGRALGERAIVRAMTDPAAARAWIDSNCCDVLLTDLQMPGIDGLELLKFARQRNAWTQVLFMTAHSTWDALTAAIENGATDYLLKPVDQAELTELLQQSYARFARWQMAVGQTMRAQMTAGR